MHPSVAALLISSALYCVALSAPAADTPQEVTIPVGPYQLHGCFWTPAGPGPYPVMTAEKGLGIRAFVAFAPAAQSWNPVLAERLKQAVRQAQAPILIIQAQNDYSVEPGEVLGVELRKKGFPNAAKIYPPFGTSAQDGHWGFGARRDGIAVWALDVKAFLDATVRGERSVGASYAF